MQYTYYHHSPVGRLEITSDGEFITAILYPDAKHKPGKNRPATSEIPEVVQVCTRELDEYFEGKRKDFSFPYRFDEGTDFQKKVWHELENIPYGQTISYGELARRIGNKNASRAVGLSNGCNPISIAVPCHRVIGADGSLTGYGGDAWVKEWLLRHEARFSEKSGGQLSLF